MKKISFLYFLSITLPFILVAQTNQIDSTNQKASNITYNDPPTTEKYGMGLSLNITGIYQLNSTSGPLIEIDGIPYPERTTSKLDYTTADLNEIARLAQIPMKSIENIEYKPFDTNFSYLGSISRNGIISITTKQGRSEKIRLDYSFKSSFKHQQKGFEMLNGDHYTTLITEEYWSTYSSDNYYPVFNDPRFNYDPSYPDYYNYNKNTDWQDEMTQTGISNEHFISLSGSSENTFYAFSAGFTNERGTTIHTGTRDHYLKANVNYKPASFIKTRLAINYNHLSEESYHHDGNNMDIYEVAVKKMPNMSVYRYEENGKITSDYFTPSDNFQGSDYYNPVAYAYSSQKDTKLFALNPIFNLEVTPIKTLKYLFDFSYQYQMNYINTCEPEYQVLYKADEKEQETKLKRKYLTHTLRYQPIYRDKSYLSVNASYSSNYYDISYQTFMNDIVASDVKSEEIIQKTINGNIQYSALNRYLLSAGLLYENYQDGDFSRSELLSGKWIISNEPLLKSLSFLNHLSIGVNYANYNTPVLDFDDIENMNNFNLNVSMELFDRITFHVNRFNRKYNDELIKSQFTGNFTPEGIAFYYDPIKASTEQNGWELNTNIKAIDALKLKMNVFANLFNVTNKLNSITHNLNEVYFSAVNGLYNRSIEPGHEYGTISGFQYKGVYQYDEYIPGTQEAAPIARDEYGNVITDIEGKPVPITALYYQFKPGDAMYQDRDFNGIIDENDVTKIGDAKPKLTGSFGASFQYKNWWLGTFFNFRYGNDIVNMARMSLTNMYTTHNQSVEVNNRWRKTGDKTDVPRALYYTGYNWLGSSRYIEDGSFVRLKAITLKHELSKKITTKLHLNHLSVYVTAKNLFTKTSYKGADPDVSLNTPWFEYGYDNNYKGITEEWTFGINVGI